MTTLQHQPTIAIIGAGLGGLALALYLKRAGFSATIYELRTSITSDGGYLSLAPNALAILDDLGLYQEVLPQGFAYEELSFLSARNCTKIGGVLNGSRARYGYPALRISRSTVRAALLNCAAEAHIPIKFGMKLMKINETRKGVILNFENGVQSTCDYVVGADGIHSRVRNNLTTVQPTFTGQIGIGGGSIPRSQIPSGLPLPCLLMGRSHSFMFMPNSADGSTVNGFATLSSPERTRESWDTLNKDKDAISRIFSEAHCGPDKEWPAFVKSAVQSANPNTLTVWPHYTCPNLDSWVSQSSRIILIGDAAHALPPSGGQGAAMAFEDAKSLARVFSQYVIPAAFYLQQWSDERQQRVQSIKLFTSTSGNTRKGSASKTQQLVKERLMQAYFLVKGKDGGLGWIYAHREREPYLESIAE